MKKRFLILAMILFCAFSVFAQKAFEQSSRSYVNVPILKTYEHKDAYVVCYVNNNNEIKYVSIPKLWFKQGSPEKKAEVRPLQKNLAPYLTICFDNDEFYFIYICMPISKLDNSWGVIPFGNSIPPEIDPKAVASGL